LINKTQSQPPSLSSNLNRGFAQPHSERTNQHNL
jgi:hypothetical protein